MSEFSKALPLAGAAGGAPELEAAPVESLLRASWSARDVAVVELGGDGADASVACVIFPVESPDGVFQSASRRLSCDGLGSRAQNCGLRNEEQGAPREGSLNEVKGRGKFSASKQKHFLGLTLSRSTCIKTERGAKPVFSLFFSCPSFHILSRAQHHGRRCLARSAEPQPAGAPVR